MLVKSSFIFSFLTFISRIFGFVRDLLLANYFGTGMLADAFNVAFRLPNLFRAIFAEGAFSAAFVPLFSSKLHTKGKKQALLFAGKVLSFLTLILLTLMALSQIFMPEVVKGIAPGFEDNQSKFDLTIQLTRITTPYLFFISLVTFYACILNSLDRFAAMAASPIVLNIAMIIGLYCFGQNNESKTISAAWSVFIGGVAQLIIMFYAVYKKKHLPKFQNLKSNKDSNKFFKNIMPAILGSGVTQINIWVGTIIATAIPGAVSIIYYADRIVQLPLSLIGVSIGIVVLPKLSKLFKSGDKSQAVFLQNRSFELALALSIPCSVALYEIAKPIVYILFQRGEFSVDDTFKTVPALLIMGFGIPAFVINKIIVSSFFANEDTRTPVKISAFCVLINAIGNYVLVKYISYVGIAVATTTAAWINVLLLVIFAIRKNIFQFDFSFKVRFLRILISCVFMYIYLEAAHGLLDKYIYSSEKILSLVSFVGMIGTSLIVYFIALFVTRAYTKESIQELLRS
ncbi:MAG: murein biosynthesis integral membrane protein MurJ [Rickettsiales bacterium]